MANKEKVKIGSSIDLESEIPFTAIVDINQAKMLLDDTIVSEKSKIETAFNGEIKKKLEDNIDLKSICRVCLSTESNMISLTSKTRHLKFADMFSAVSCIKVSLCVTNPRK